jgi:cytochrome-b5 reductase
MFQVIRAICEHDRDTTEVSLLYANRSEQDILLRDELDTFARRYPKNFKVYYLLDQPPKDWKFGSGYITKELMQERLPAPTVDSKVFLCGPPGMVNASKKALVDLGFEQPGASAKVTDQIFAF